MARSGTQRLYGQPVVKISNRRDLRLFELPLPAQPPKILTKEGWHSHLAEVRLFRKSFSRACR